MMPSAFARSIRTGGLAAALVTVAAVWPTSPGAARSSWVIDPAHTRIGFSIDATGYPRTDGSFRDFVGQIAVDLDHPAQSRVGFRVKAASVDVGSRAFDDYVRSEVFLDSARFPEIAFASTSVEKVDDHRVHVVGNLTLLGQTRPLTVDVDVRSGPAGQRARLRFVAHAKIDRLAYGMNSGWPMISGDIDLVVASEVVEQ